MSADPSPPPEPDVGGADGHRPAGRNLPLAIVSGLALAGLFLLAVFVSPEVVLAFVTVVVVLALYELDRAFAVRGIRPATPVIAGAAVVIVFGGYLLGPRALAVGLILAVAGSAAWPLVLRRPATLRVFSADFAASALMACWVPLLAGFLGLLLARDAGEWYVIAAIALAVFNDIGAYGFGTRFGRRRMAPKVSPGKTWEGTAGGVATVLVLTLAASAVVPGFTPPVALAFGLGVAIAATLGDLTESLVKRDLGLKDLGTLIPGHGGVMDRIDAIVFALPVAHLVLASFGL